MSAVEGRAALARGEVVGVVLAGPLINLTRGQNALFAHATNNRVVFGVGHWGSPCSDVVRTGIFPPAPFLAARPDWLPGPDCCDREWGSVSKVDSQSERCLPRLPECPAHALESLGAQGGNRGSAPNGLTCEQAAVLDGLAKGCAGLSALCGSSARSFDHTLLVVPSRVKGPFGSRFVGDPASIGRPYQVPLPAKHLCDH